MDVLKNDYGLSVVKKCPGKSSCKKRIQNLSIDRACQFVGISRQAYYKRNRAYAARLILDQKVADFVQQKRLRQPRLGTRKLYYLLQCQPSLTCKWVEIACFRFCVNGVYWKPASGRITSQPTAITAFGVIQTCSNQPLIKLFPSTPNKSGWLTSPICRRRKAWPI